MNILLSVLGGIGKSVTSAITSVVSTVVQGLISALTVAIKGAATLAVGAVMAFVSVVQSSISALREFASSVTSISDQTGATIGQSLNLVTQLRAVGIGAQEAASMFNSINMNPQLFNMRASALGAPRMDDPNFAPKMSEWFQSQSKGGLGGYMGARGKLDSLFDGPAPQSILRLVNRDPKKLREETAYNQRVQSSLGIKPDDINQVNEGLERLMNRVSMFIDTVKIKFGQSLLPTLEAIFGAVSEMFVQNADGIARAISTAGRWMFVEAPDLAMRAGAVAINWAFALADGFLAAGRAVVVLMRGVQSRDGVLYSILMTGARFIDFFTNFGGQFMIGLTYVRLLLQNYQAQFLKWVRAVGGEAGNKYANFIESIYGKAEEVDINTEMPKVVKRYTGTDLQGGLEKSIQDQKWGNGANGMASTIDSTQAEVDRARSWAGTQLNHFQEKMGTKEERAQKFDSHMNKLISVQEEGNRLTKENGEKIAGAITSTSSGTLGAIGAYIAQDAYRLASR